MRKQLVAVAALSVFAVPAFAEIFPVPDTWQVVERIELKDGTTLNVYKDGKSAMENRFGQSVPITPGHTMQTADGRAVTMRGNETIRVEVRNPLSSPRI